MAGALVLLDDRVGGAAALADVALEPANEAQVRVGVDVHLDVHERAQGGIPQDQQSVHDDHLARLRVLAVRQSPVFREVVERDRDTAPGPQLPQVLGEQLRLE